VYLDARRCQQKESSRIKRGGPTERRLVICWTCARADVPGGTPEDMAASRCRIGRGCGHMRATSQSPVASMPRLLLPRAQSRLVSSTPSYAGSPCCSALYLRQTLRNARTTGRSGRLGATDCGEPCWRLALLSHGLDEHRWALQCGIRNRLRVRQSSRGGGDRVAPPETEVAAVRAVGRLRR
jgi:hypothetical protein